WCGHRDDSVRGFCERFTRRITRWPHLRLPYTPVTNSATALHHYRGLNSAGTPDQADVTLVHGDFHLLNVLTDHASGNVVAVLDWELCTLGDPLAEIGSTMAYWTQLDDEPIVGFRGRRWRASRIGRRCCGYT